MTDQPLTMSMFRNKEDLLEAWNEKLRQRVAVLEVVIREELHGDDCGDDANRMIVEQIHEKMSPVSNGDR